MRPLTAFGSSFRIVMAMVFGFMSLAHGPVMAFAQDKAAPAHHQHHQLASNHAFQPVPTAAEHTPGHRHTLAPGPANTICYSAGCFIAVAPISVSPVPGVSLPLQRLGPATAQAIVPAEPDLVDPPPRLQA